MDRRLVSGLALAAGLGLAACTERPQEQSLQDPSSVANIISEPCTPTAFNSLIAGYFVSPQPQQTVKGYKDAMLAELDEAPADSAAARTFGFNILREIALAAKGVPQPNAATGSQLAVEVLECIYDVTDDDVIEQVPGAGFFTDALTRQGGGFEVRGGTGDPLVAVQAAAGDPLKVISGIAPPPPQPNPLTTAWWGGSLDGQRVLFYGERGASPGTYHWSVVPRAASFDPALVVTTCVDDALVTGGVDPNSVMLTESGVGVLAFVEASYIGCGGTPAVTASAGRFDLLRHLASLGRKLLAPEPAAAAAVMPGLVGGSAKGVKSLFDIMPVPSVLVGLVTDPSPIGTLVVNSGRFGLTVTTTSGGTLVNGVLVTLALEANNGVTNSVRIPASNGTCTGGVPSAVTGSGNFATGTVTFPSLCITKTGNVKVVVNAQAVGRSGSGSAKTAKIKVIPN
jgi:hypothetical protein